MHIREIQEEIHTLAVKKGWWDMGNRGIAEQISNMHSELSEAWEEIRNNKGTELYFDGEKPEGFGIELADCVIRIMDTCAAYGIDLEHMIEIKHSYNKTRPYRHGGKSA